MESGTRLGLYEILGPIGAGGMGEVYLARDSKLDREVAIKVLPAALAGDPERLGRLEREARVLAALDHPNVAAVYGLDESDGVTFLVMQLAPGETLAERLAAGPLPLDEALEIAGQIAEGLEAAHERGILHRDLKPANIMVGPGGEVKILDFGLAKALGSESAANSQASELSASPTMLAVTSAGMILGTAAYMSPEQARGRPLDRRTDIWSFGCVLYEMLAGTKSFAGETVTDLLAAVITREPDWDHMPTEMPASLDRMLRRCFDKDPRQRVQDIGELRIALASRDGDEVASQLTGQAPSSRRGGADRLGWPVAAVMAVLAAALGWQLWHAPVASETPAYLALHEPEIRLVSNTETIQVAVSPDGRSVAIAGQDEEGPGIWIRNLMEPRARRLPGTEGFDLAWSPDGQQVAFVDGDGLRLHDLRTGANSVRYRGEGIVNSPRWTADGRLTFSVNLGREFRILESLSSGQNATLLSVVSGSGGSGLRSYPLGESRFLVSRWNAAHGHVDTAVFHPDGQADEPLLHLDAAPEWAPPDLLLFARDGALWAQRFDVVAGQLRGEPVALLVEVDTAPGVTPWLSIGGDTLSYRTGLGQESPTVLEWVDRGGGLVHRAGEPGNYFDPRIAPDGRTIVFDLSNEGDAGDIWLGVGDGPGVRLTSSPADETRPVWAPDGSSVVLETTRDGQPSRLYLKNVSHAAGELQVLGADPAVDEPTDWAGDTIVGNDGAMTTIWIVDAATGESRPFRETNFADYGGALAPDASHIAYVSNETGRDEIWVDTFPSPGTPRRVSPQGGTTPVWRRDGKEIVYLDPDGFITSVAVTSMSPLALAQPEPLFQVSLRLHAVRQFDVSPDGQRFLLNRVVENPDLPIRLLLGWREELARRAGPDW